ncbi:MAG: hypothetical protein LBR84_06410, partial [Tannerella sp.]|nr:hypothetical protein [Tannerella sp.]
PDYYAGNGSYPNPVALLGSDSITYTIRAVNASIHTGSIISTDTLPTYLDVRSVSSAPPLTSSAVVGSPPRTALKWVINNLAPLKDTVVSVTVSPQSGAVASQPLFVNYAVAAVPYPWADSVDLHYSFPHKGLSDSLYVKTNATYHQGAGVAVVTFSASVGGAIFNAEPQAADYRTTLRYASSLIVVPDSGYVFVGWSHPAYVSLRGVEIPATYGILSLDTLVIQGDVELTAMFEAENLNKVPNLVKVEETTAAAPTPAIGSSGNELFARTASDNAILRIYTPEGVLRYQHLLLSKGVHKFRLPSGVYVATLNRSPAFKIIIE